MPTSSTTKIKVYLSARISKDAHQWNRQVCATLTAPFEVFMPQDINPWREDHRSFPYDVFALDLAAMKASDMGLLLPDYGRDCAWEAGWYANSNKPLVVFVHEQTDWLRDWMVKGGVDYVLTDSRKARDIFQDDPILKQKSVELLPSLSHLPDALVRIVAEGK